MTVVSVDRKQLVDALKHLKKMPVRASQGKGDKPVKIVTFTAQKRRLLLASGNGVEQVVWKLDADSTISGVSSATLAPEPMLALLDATKSEIVTLTLADEAVTIESQPVTAHVATVVRKMPTIRRPTGATVPLTVNLRAAILRAVDHASDDETRPVLELVMFDRGSVVATDSYTLAVSEGLRMLPKFAVPAAPLGRAVAGAAADALLVVGPRSIRIADGSRVTTIARPFAAGIDLADKYPKWWELLTRPAATVVEFGREEMREALRSPTTMKAESVTITQDDYRHARQPLHVTGVNVGKGVVSSTVQATLGKLPGPLTFSVERLHRALAAQTSPTVRMLASRTPRRDESTPGMPPILNPVRLIDGHCTVLVVPMLPPR